MKYIRFRPENPIIFLRHFSTFFSKICGAKFLVKNRVFVVTVLEKSIGRPKKMVDKMFEKPPLRENPGSAPALS